MESFTEFRSVYMEVISMANDYKDTLFLPKTDFPMRANLSQREPEFLKFWYDIDVYGELKKKNKDKPSFILHDGPPYANASIHIGTATNKILKDFVVKYKWQRGYFSPYVPGYDTHGLPIELKVLKEQSLNKDDIDPVELREKCAAYARSFADIQTGQFKRLGVIGDWDHPYMTLVPAYEATQIEGFAEMVDKGLVYKGRKAIYWCTDCQTALAAAEIEYADETSPSIFVAYKYTDAAKVFPELAGKDVEVIIWTTTPWTLPASMAVAVHPRYDYGFYQVGDKIYLIAQGLKAEVERATQLEFGEPILSCKGEKLENTLAQHPFYDRVTPFVLADYVTLDSGTGCVHTAPGHGTEDYETGVRYGLEIYNPVDETGHYYKETPIFGGMSLAEGEKKVFELLGESKRLLGRLKITHSYPHCWRCKKPVIFRATDQWFVSVADFRDEALKCIDEVKWVPDWGKDRITNMVRDRSDWCISRQRTWGVPLPVFFDEDGKAVLDAALVRKIADMVEAHGSNIWFELSDEDLCERLGLPKTWKKGKDTLDVWIDSGCSHMAVMDARPGLDAPADLYLEATDQHRGWFQSSLMLSVAWRGKAPYKAVMTHGFVVDKDTGKKTSKSDAKSGKPIDAAYYYDKYGADIVRLWAASVDWQNEVPFGEDLFKQVTEPYRRLRNTLRILLGNISGFDFATQAVAPEHMPILDRWILERLNAVIKETLKAYEAYDFRKAFSVINQFCTSDLSALYVDTTKDRLYCDDVTSVRRRATQTAMTIVFKALCRLLAPILVFTADEAWEYAGYEGSVHEQDFPAPMPEYDTQEASSAISRLQEIKSVIQVAIEEQVKAKAFSKNNEASITLTVPTNESEDVVALLEDRAFATEFFIIADLDVKSGPELAATAAKTEHAMCPRCRRYEPAADGSDVCERCSEVLS